MLSTLRRYRWPHYSYPLACLFTCLLTSCDLFRSTEIPLPEPPEEKAHPCLIRKNVLLYIDITETMKGEGIEVVAKRSKTILSTLPPGSKLTVRLVDRHSEQANFFEYKTDASLQNIKDELETYKETNARRGSDLSQKIKAKFEALQDEDRRLHTCLLSTFEEACQFFRSEKAEKYEFHLIYISDLIEQCHSDYGDINFITDQGQPVDTFIQAVSGQFKEVKLKSLVGTNLHFIIASSGEVYRGHGILGLKGLRDFWTATLMQMGYSEEEIQQHCNFRTEVPDEFKNLCFEAEK